MRQNSVAIIRDHLGRILLIHENYHLYRFGPPGGTVEAGETPAQAAAREVMEETGLQVEVGECLLAEKLMGQKGQDTFLAHAFEAAVISGEPSLPRPDEIQSVGWYDLDDLPLPLTTTLTALLPILQGQ